MQHNKSIKNIKQTERISQNDKQTTRSISEVIDKSQITSVFKEIDLVKQCGASPGVFSFAIKRKFFFSIAETANIIERKIYPHTLS